MNIEDRQQLLEEAIELVRFSDIHLGDEIPEQEVDPLKEKAVALLEGLKKEQVEFSPKLSVSPLIQEDCQINAEQGLAEIKRKMREQDFYNNRAQNPRLLSVGCCVTRCQGPPTSPCFT